MSVFKNNFVTGITAALAVSIIGPVLMPAIKRSSRPVAKALIRGGFSLYEKGREAVAGAGETMEDLIAEVQAEEMEKHLATMDENAEQEGMRTETDRPAAGEGGSRLSPVRSNAATSPHYEGGTAS